jgi:hypothetical protein
MDYIVVFVHFEFKFSNLFFFVFFFHFTTTDEIKEFYNERFDEICDIVCPEELLKEPTKVKGYYLDSVDKKIKTKNNAMYEDRLGVVNSHDQISFLLIFTSPFAIAFFK